MFTSLLTGSIKTPMLALIDQALFSATNLVLQLFIARSVSADAFGAYAIGSSYFFLAALVHQTLVIEPMYVFSSRRYRGHVGAYLQLLRRGWSLVCGFAVLAAGLLIGGAVLAPVSPLLAQMVGASATVSPFLLYFLLLRRMAFLGGRLDLAVLGSLVYAIAVIAGASILFFAEAMSATGGIALQGIAALAAALVIRLKMNWQPAADMIPNDVLRQHWRYGRWSLGSELVNWLINNGPLLLLPLWFGLAASATFRVLGLLFMPLLQAASTLTAVLLRRLASHSPDTEGLRPALPYFCLLLGGGLCYTLLIAGIGPIATMLLFGMKYSLDSEIILLAGSSVSLIAAAQAFFTALRAGERSRDVFITHLVVLAITASASIALLRLGIAGVLAAQSIAWLAGTLAAGFLLMSGRRH